MSNFYVYHHFGLGDFISCNGLIRSLLKKVKVNHNLYLFTPTKYKKMISFMYRDESKIKIIPLKINKEMIFEASWETISKTGLGNRKAISN